MNNLKILDLSNRDFLALLFYTVILFSGFTYIAFDVGGLYFFEAAFALALLFSVVYRDSASEMFVASVANNGHLIFWCLFVLLFLFVIGAIVGGSVINSYTDLRSLVFMVLGFAFARQSYKDNIVLLAWFGLLTSLSWCVYWIYLYKFSTLPPKFPTPVLSGIVAVYLFGIIGNVRMIALSVISVIFLSSVALYRQYWLYAFVSVIIAGLSYSRHTSNTRALTFYIVGGFVAVILGYIAVGYVVRAGEVDESIYIQTVGKFEDLVRFFEGQSELSESDLLRSAYFEYIFSEFFNLLLPHGLGHRSFFGYVDSWFYQFSIEPNTIDSMLLYMVYHFGWLLTIVCICLVFLRSWRLVKVEGFTIWLAFTIVLSMGLFFDGGVFTVITRAFWLGALLSLYAVGEYLSKADNIS